MKGEMLTAVITVLIVIGSSIIAVNMITPTLDEGKSFQTYNEAKKTMEAIDAAISQVFYEAPGARRVIDVNLQKGKMAVSGSEEKIKIRLDDVKLFTPGLRKQEGNILVTSGAQVESYEADIDSDGVTDLVLENDAVLFAVKKMGTPDSYGFVNTSNMITLIRNKRLNLDIYRPRSGIFINNSVPTSFGVGYSELAQVSENIASSGIHIYVNATNGNVTYDAIFTLGPSQDFIEFYATHVTGI
jgi:hypothetical protein